MIRQPVRAPPPRPWPPFPLSPEVEAAVHQESDGRLYFDSWKVDAIAKHRPGLIEELARAIGQYLGVPIVTGSGAPYAIITALLKEADDIIEETDLDTAPDGFPEPEEINKAPKQRLVEWCEQYDVVIDPRLKKADIRDTLLEAFYPLEEDPP